MRLHVAEEVVADLIAGPTKFPRPLSLSPPVLLSLSSQFKSVPCLYLARTYHARATMESAALEALDLPDESQSQSQSQPWTQTQTQQTQPSQGQSQGNSSRFPSDLWGILVAVTGHRAASTSEAAAAAPPPPHKAAAVAAGTDDPSKQTHGAALNPPPPPPAALPRPERLELFKGQNSYMVGRHPKSDLRLNGPKISSTHAKIWIDPKTGIIRLENLGTNGTYVRNSKVSELLPLLFS